MESGRLATRIREKDPSIIGEVKNQTLEYNIIGIILDMAWFESLNLSGKGIYQAISEEKAQ